MALITKISAKTNTLITPLKVRLLLEWLALFFGVPLMIAQGWLPVKGQLGKLGLLLGAALLCLIYLLWDKSFNKRRLGGITKFGFFGKALFLRAVLCALLLLLLAWLFFPERMFGFIKYNPRMWLMVFILYPLLSACPQELIYRAFMFQRYQKLFGAQYGIIIASAAAFAFLHIIYLNWLALLLTFIAGFVFSLNYKQTGYLVAPIMEHAIYGNLIFTIGFGTFFFRVL